MEADERIFHVLYRYLQSVVCCSRAEFVPGGGLPEPAARPRPCLPRGVRGGPGLHFPHSQPHEPAQRAGEPQPHRVHQRCGHAQHAAYVCFHAL